MNSGKAFLIAAGFLVGIVLWGGTQVVQWAAAQEAQAPSQGAAAKKEPKEPVKDYNQRSLEIYEFKKAAKTGSEPGEEIYYYKCWYCHNEYTKGAPQLKDLYKRPQLLSGQPVNDETVKEKIQNGGPAMPAYRYTLSDADLADLVSFVREKCCWNSESPPANPRYRSR